MSTEIYDNKFDFLKEKLYLTGNSLKLIAIIAMTIDHLSWMGIEEYSQAMASSHIISFHN